MTTCTRNDPNCDTVEANTCFWLDEWCPLKILCLFQTTFQWYTHFQAVCLVLFFCYVPASSDRFIPKCPNYTEDQLQHLNVWSAVWGMFCSLLHGVSHHVVFLRLTNTTLEKADYTTVILFW